MQTLDNSKLELGILGGGQLGKMLIEAGSDWNVRCHVLDPDPEASCAHLAHTFVCGSFKDYDTVYQFGKQLDQITIEIEHVHVGALMQLEQEGKRIYPQPGVLAVIQDKGKQKMFYEDNDLPTSAFQFIDSKDELIKLIEEDKLSFPFVQKTCAAGYDGKGVAVIRSKADLDKLLDGESIIEDLVDIEKELSVIVARNAKGATACFPVVEMEFHPKANLVEFLLSPAHITAQQEQAAIDIAVRCIEAFDMQGILAVELFLTRSGEILINEVAPRPHNSGHHTIEANYTSQYQQLLRCILDLPLGSTAARAHAVMVNVLGAEGYAGEARYAGLPECLALEGVYVHLYGKKMTKPFRKMGHVTIIGQNEQVIRERAAFIKDNLRVIA